MTPQIWPEIRDSASPPSLRLRRASATEIQERTLDGLTVHRFLPASGGCLWTVESHARRRPGESRERFARRRQGERERAMALVDTAAGYFASLL